jgi:hypothetical protein
VLQHELLEHLEPVLEDREAPDERERDGDQRDDREQRRERQAAGRAREIDVAQPADDALEEAERIDGGPDGMRANVRPAGAAPRPRTLGKSCRKPLFSQAGRRHCKVPAASGDLPCHGGTENETLRLM